MKPGFSVSTINPSKSKTIAASVILNKPKNRRFRLTQLLSSDLLSLERGFDTASGSALDGEFEELAIGKKTLQLQGSILRAVRSVDHIDHGISAEIASDGSLRRFAGIGGAHQVTNKRHGVFA